MRIWCYIVMNAPVSSSPTCFAALSELLALVIGGIRRVVAARGGRDHASVPLVVLVCTRLNRLMNRFQALVARLAAGRPVTPRRQRTRPARVAPAAGACCGCGATMPG